MKTIRPTLTILALVAGLTAFAGGHAAALEPLKNNKRVQGEFLSAAVGDEIRKNCPDLSARMFRVWRKAMELEQYALGLGYSRDDITALRKDETAKAQLKQMRDAYLARNGVTPGDAESYCRLGREEIEKNTLTGWLLREN
jgi:hypothetical protein